MRAKIKNPEAVLHLELSAEQMLDLIAWAKEHDKPVAELARTTLMDAVAA